MKKIKPSHIFGWTGEEYIGETIINTSTIYQQNHLNIVETIANTSAKNYLMKNNGFSVGFNMPKALSGESTFQLPPYAKCNSYLVDKYPACPKDWMRSEGIVKSFFVPVKEGMGMWLDLNDNSNHTHNVAIVISVQGINPITGMPCNDAQLEQYIEECPKHKIKFGPDRYCSKCDYKWPKQNYISTTATPNGQLWIDGFRTIEGVVRQYILTAEKMRGVASNIIGKDRVYAIGLSFFISKEKKPTLDRSNILRSKGSTTKGCGGETYKYLEISEPDLYYDSWGCGSCSCELDSGSLSYDAPKDSLKTTNYYGSSLDGYSSIIPIGSSDNKSRSITGQTIRSKKLEVGAGAKIKQPVYDDPEKLDFWNDKPESIICINYVDEKTAKEIIDQGEINIEGHTEGFLKEIPVGN